MTYVLVQHGSWPGWSPNADIYLEAGTAAAYLTAARDYHTATGRTDAGIAEPLGGLRSVAQIAEMQWAFDHRGTSQSAALYQKYNMDPHSNARPVLNSPHASGLCVDIASIFFLNWLIANGARYGLRRTLVAANDTRHFQYFPGTATAALDVTGFNNATPKGAIMPEVLLHISDTTGKAVKSGEYYYHRDGVTPIVGPLSGGDPTKAGGIYWLNTVAGVPIKDVGGATFEFYQADQAKRVLAGGTVNVTNPPVDISGLATGAEVADLAEKVSAIHVPTKGTVELA